MPGTLGRSRGACLSNFSQLRAGRSWQAQAVADRARAGRGRSASSDSRSRSRSRSSSRSRSASRSASRSRSRCARPPAALLCALAWPRAAPACARFGSSHRSAALCCEMRCRSAAVCCCEMRSGPTPACCACAAGAGPCCLPRPQAGALGPASVSAMLTSSSANAVHW